MDTLPQQKISVLEPIGAAIDKTKQILFQPFNLGKWFVLGFVAWLATMWERGRGGGGGNGGGGVNINHNGDTANIPAELSHELHQVKEVVLQNLPFIISAVVVILLFAFVLAIVLTWLKSRFQFIFLHNVAHNNTEIANPWNRYSRQGNSLFVFKVLLWLAGAVISLAFISPLIFIFIAFAKTDFKVFAAAGIIPAILLVIGFVCFCFIMAIINVLTKDFVVPVMYLQNCTIIEGWKRFWQLARHHKGVFLLFLLILFVLNIAISIIVGLGMCVACCCFCFISWIFLIPIIGGYFFTVLTLPLWVWRRAYSALFLAQFGPEYDVFPKLNEVVVLSDSVPPSGPETQPPEQNF